MTAFYARKRISWILQFQGPTQTTQWWKWTSDRVQLSAVARYVERNRYWNDRV